MRTDFHGHQNNPKIKKKHRAVANVDFVVYNHEQAGIYGFAVATLTVRTRKGVVVKDDAKLAIELGNLFKATPKVWIKGEWRIIQ